MVILLVSLAAIIAACWAFTALVMAFADNTPKTCANCDHCGADGACWCIERLGLGEHVETHNTCPHFRERIER